VDNALIHDLVAVAHHDHQSVIELTRDLVTIPSRGGIDAYEPVLDRVGAWLAQRHLPVTTLTDKTDAIVGLTCEVAGTRPGPRWVLDACLDTAPFGDERAWTHPPTSALTAEGWIWGRGSSDSKSGAAVFRHIAARLATIRDRWRGTLVLLFDVDEHTGGSVGMPRWMRSECPRFVQLNDLRNDLTQCNTVVQGRVSRCDDLAVAALLEVWPW
jgi:succinyl-diaminopimelate desuccinylase